MRKMENRRNRLLEADQMGRIRHFGPDICDPHQLVDIKNEPC
jgi:hypothetical protein